MNWTNEKPTTPGWYWTDLAGVKWVVRVYQQRGVLTVHEHNPVGQALRVEDVTWRFAGPIDEPIANPEDCAWKCSDCGLVATGATPAEARELLHDFARQAGVFVERLKTVAAIDAELVLKHQAEFRAANAALDLAGAHTNGAEGHGKRQSLSIAQRVVALSAQLTAERTRSAKLETALRQADTALGACRVSKDSPVRLCNASALHRLSQQRR